MSVEEPFARSKFPTELWEQATAWLTNDPDPETRSQLEEMLNRGSVEKVASCFSAPLSFGTAGLRGEMGPGPARMNRVVVRQAAAGLAGYLGTGARVVIGYDARHNSQEFATESAQVFAAAGLRALLLPQPMPTPVLAFAVRWLGCDGGVMVTASHNPRNDNGYKVYLGDGAQITPPHDQNIEVSIRDHAAALIRLAEVDNPNIEYLDDSVISAYLNAVIATPRFAESTIKTVYTPMHGVGGKLLVTAFQKADLAVPSLVENQFHPDGDFPTLPFPNPEEPGALDEAIATAKQVGATMILANDPDADRLGVALQTANGWRSLTGNEIGALLGDYLLRNTTGDDRLVATTIVSSRLLQKLADTHGIHYQDTLTGFKWVVRPAIENSALRFVFGYEEALGFLVTDQVRDKDGISAAVTFACICEELAAQGSNPLQRLAEIYLEHGVHTTQTWQIRFQDTSRIPKLMADARSSFLTNLAGLEVTRTTDYKSENLMAAGLGTNALGWELGNRARVLLRPSGTEPKAKFYLEVFTNVDHADDLAGAEEKAQELIAAIRADLTNRFALIVAEGE